MMFGFIGDRKIFVFINSQVYRFRNFIFNNLINSLIDYVRTLLNWKISFYLSLGKKTLQCRALHTSTGSSNSGAESFYKFNNLWFNILVSVRHRRHCGSSLV